MKKTEIKRIEQVTFYDLDHRIIYHMCYWKIYYASGSERTIKGHGSEKLNKTQRKWYIEHKLQGTWNGFYGESAYTKTRSYY